MRQTDNFREALDRMCREYHKPGFDLPCAGCPLEDSVQGITRSCCAYSGNMWRPEDYVAAVHKWNVEHPINTNAGKFFEVFGFWPPMELWTYNTNNGHRINKYWWNREYQQ